MASPDDPALRHAETQQMLSRLWSRSTPVVRKRLEILSAAAKAADDGTLTAAVREDAISEAHKLAGSLGMFGFAEGTELAREIEVLLEEAEKPSGERLFSLVNMLSKTLFPDSE